MVEVERCGWEEDVTGEKVCLVDVVMDFSLYPWDNGKPEEGFKSWAQEGHMMRYAFSKGHFVLIGGELEWTQKNSYDSRTK